MDIRPRHPEERPSAPRRSRPREDDLEPKAREAVTLARRYFDMLRERPSVRGAFISDPLLEEIRASYSGIMAAIAKARDVQVWEAEREILPDDIKNLRTAPFGLPAATVPFSLANGWENPLLEMALRELPDRTNVLIAVARILDRYVQASFPIEAVSEFYRDAVIDLQLSSTELDEPAYVFRLILLSRELTEKHHNLKMELHKSIDTETGDSLAQPDPANTPKLILKKLSFEKRANTSEEIARSLRQKLRVPYIDGIVPPRYQPPVKADMDKQLDIVLKSGREACYSHLGLPGMEFTSDQAAVAFSIVRYADFFTQISGTGLKAPVELVPLLNALCQSEEFAEVTLKRDRNAQFMMALEVTSKATHVLRLMEADAALEAPEAWALADEDFATAKKMVEEYRKVRFSTPDHMTLTGVKRMLQIGKESHDVADFDLALEVIAQKRANRESLTTLRPPPPELAPQAAPAEPETAKGRLEFPFPDEALDLDLEAMLPKGGSESDVLVGRVARTIRYYVSLGQTDGVLPVYLPAVTRLLGSYSNEDVLALAEALVHSETKAPRHARTLLGFVPKVAPAPAVDITIPDAEATAEEPDSFAQEAETKPGLLASQQAPSATEAEVPVTTEEPEAGFVHEAVTRPDLRPSTLMLQKLRSETPDSLTLVMEILGKEGECAEADLEAFIALPPGARDLRFRNVLSRVWTEGDWRGQPEIGEQSESDHKRSCMGRLYHVCGLVPASMGDMHKAALDKPNLSLNQLLAVGKLFGVPHHSVTPKMIEGFGAWMSGDPNRRKAYWEANYPNVFELINLSQKMVMRSRTYSDADYELLGKVLGKPADKITREDLKVEAVQAYIDSVRRFEHFWNSPTKAQRRAFWRSGSLDSLAMSDLIHRMSFLQGWDYAPEDYRLMARVYERNPADKDDMNGMASQFVNAMLHKFNDGDPCPEVAAVRDKLVANPLRDLLESARAHEEFATLCDFLGSPVGRAKGNLVSANSSCRQKIAKERFTLVSIEKEESGVSLVLQNGKGQETAKFISQSTVDGVESVEIEDKSGERKIFQVVTDQDGKKTLIREVYAKTNDDALSQALVTLEDGSVVELDAVFDGMGGHDSGYIASGFMKSVFEISALSGWIETPEDARKAIVLADFVITIEQYNKRQRGERKMGTTATIGFQRGEDFYAIHVGDSDAKVFRDGQMVFSTLGHSLVNQLLQNGATLNGKAKKVADVLVKYMTSAQFDPPDTSFRILDSDTLRAETDGRVVRFSISRSDKVVCQGIGSPMLHEKLIEALEFEMGNIVTGAVGNTITPASINNQKHGYAPFKTQAGDVKLICSDGITVPLCAHETLIAIEQCSGDLKQAAELLVDWAESRRPNGQKVFATTCECGERGSKNDDKSVILKRVVAP